MPRSKRGRSRRPYYAPQPQRVPGPDVTPGRRGRPAGRGGSSLPLIPVSLAGLGVGLLVIAFLVLNRPDAATPSSGELATPPVTSYGQENPDQSLGPADAPVTVAIWGDFQCPACAAFARLLERELISTYVGTGKVRLVFHNMAFLGNPGIDPLGINESVQAATAARCAGQQGRFWPYQGYLYANQGPRENAGTFSPELLDRIARAIGLDMAKFDACLSGGDTKSTVLAETTQGQQQGITQTPTIIAGSRTFQGVPSWEQLNAAIQAALTNPSGSPSHSGSPSS